MGKGKTTTTTNKDTNYSGISQKYLPKELQGDLLGALSGGFSDYFGELANRPGVYMGGPNDNQKLAGSGAADLVGYLGGANTASTGMLDGASADTSALTNLLGNNNVSAANVAPGLDRAINAATDKALQGVNSQYAAGGRLGSNAFGDAVGEGVANAAASVLTPVMTADANRQLQADQGNQSANAALANNIVSSNFKNAGLDLDTKNAGVGNLLSLLGGEQGTLTSLVNTGNNLFNIDKAQVTDANDAQQQYLNNLFKGLGFSDMVSGTANDYDETVNQTETERKKKASSKSWVTLLQLCQGLIKMVSWNPAWANAIANIESRGSGGYSAIGPKTRTGDRAYGKYQVMGDNLPKWTKKYFGKVLSPQEFLNNPEAQEAVFRGEFGSYVNQYGNPQDAASIWFTGRPANLGAKRSDGYNTGAQYVTKFNKFLGGTDMAQAQVNSNPLDMLLKLGGLGGATDSKPQNTLPPFQQEEQQTLLERLGLQKMVEGAEGETGKRFYQRDNFLDLVNRFGAVASDNPVAQQVALNNINKRAAKRDRNKTAGYLNELGETDLAQAVGRGILTGKEAMDKLEDNRKYNRDINRADQVWYRELQAELAKENRQAARNAANKTPGMKQDVNGQWRYTEGDNRGKLVFPDVAKQDQYRIASDDEISAFRKAAGLGENDPLGGALFIDGKTGKPTLIKTGKGDTNVSINMNDSDSELIKQQAKLGYRPKRTADGNFVRDANGQLDFELIPESEAAKDEKDESLAERKRNFMMATQAEIDNDIIGSAIKEATDILDKKFPDGPDGEGKGFWRRLMTLDLPETGVYSQYLKGYNQEVESIANALKPLKAKIAFERLQRMRDASKTGGALGNVSNIELELLANSMGNIEQTSDPRVFYKNLMNIERIYTKILNDPIAFRLKEAKTEEEFDRLLTEYRSQQGDGEAAPSANFSVGGQNYKITPKR